MYDIASRIAGFLACNVGLEKARVDTVRFGLEVILGELFKWFILLGVATLLGVLPGALFAMISTAVFRMFSGGAHCEDYWRCLVFGILVFLGSGKMGIYLEPHLDYLTLVIIIAVGTLAMAVPVLYWAPGEVPNRRIKVGERTHFKKLSLLFLLVWAGVSVFLVVPLSFPVALAGLLAMTVQSLSFTPYGYRVIDQFDIILSRILGERRCSHA